MGAGAVCGGEVTAAPGSLASPLYPRPFSGAANCRWHLTLPAAENATTLLTFSAFSLEDTDNCRTSRVAVRPGGQGR